LTDYKVELEREKKAKMQHFSFMQMGQSLIFPFLLHCFLLPVLTYRWLSCRGGPLRY